MDWEHPTSPTEGRDFEKLLAALRQVLPVPKYHLTCALPVGEWVLKHLNLRRLAFLDFFNLMAYDFAGPWTPLSNHHSRLYTTRNGPLNTNSGEAGVKYLISGGFPSNKICLSIPLYGRSFVGASDIGQPFRGGGGKDGVYLYKELPLPNTQEMVDESAVAAFCIGENCEFISYDNPTSVIRKAQFVKQHKLAGVFFWQGAGDAEGSRSLILAAHQALHTPL